MQPIAASTGCRECCGDVDASGRLAISGTSPASARSPPAIQLPPFSSQHFPTCRRLSLHRLLVRILALPVSARRYALARPDQQYPVCLPTVRLSSDATSPLFRVLLLNTTCTGRRVSAAKLSCQFRPVHFRFFARRRAQRYRKHTRLQLRSSLPQRPTLARCLLAAATTTRRRRLHAARLGRWPLL